MMAAKIQANDTLGAHIHDYQVRFFSGTVDENDPPIIFSPHVWDAWRHERQYSALLPIIHCAPGASWLTVGDSGGDAFWLAKQGVKNILATSLVDNQLKSHVHRGILKNIEVRSLDAQNMDIPDGSFDYTLCKEAYHHFERPVLGLYEMLRVSRKAVVMIAEPFSSDRWYMLDAVKRAIKIVLRRNTHLSNPEFEASGNYIYGLSLQETVKIATALQIGPVFSSQFSDFCVLGLVSRPRTERLPGLVLRLAIAVQNFLSRLGLMSWGRTSIIVFKSAPSPSEASALRRVGFKRTDIKRNPYI